MNKKTALVTFSHLVFLFAIYYVFLRLSVIQTDPLKANMVLCDAYWYDQLKDFGYYYIPDAMCNMAYFPLFAGLWKLLNLDGLGISIVNLVLFFIMFNILLGKKEYSIGYLFVIVSIPSYIFFALPYSESLFFFFGALTIMGFKTKSDRMVCLGLIGMGLTRSVALFFIPAIILTEYIYYKVSAKKLERGEVLKRTVLYCIACIVPIIVVTLMQVRQTGLWFYYLKIQQYWGRNFQLPSLPFTTEAPGRVIGVDSIALIVGVLSAFFVLSVFLSSHTRNQVLSKINLAFGETPRFPRYLLFSLLYLASIAFLDSFFTDDINNQTKIWSINRHTFCSPFFICFLTWFKDSSSKSKSKLEVVAVFVIIIVGAMITVLYKYNYHLLYYLLFFTTLLIIPMTMAHTTKSVYRNSLYAALYICNIALTLIFYQAFLNDLWIG